MDKEYEHRNKSLDGVAKLQEYIVEKGLPLLEINEFSHHNVSLMFNHIL